MRRLVVPFVLAAVLTGCSSTEQGTPTTGKPTSGTPTTGTSAGTAPVDRPKAVDLKTLDPCSLYTSEVKTALGVRTVTPRDPKPEYGEGSKTCGNTYEDRTYTSSIYTLVNGGVDRLKRTTSETELTPLQVAGYPAYLTKDPQTAFGPGCDIYIDANDGQLLLVNAVGDSKSTMDAACGQAKKFANAIGAMLAAK